MEQQKLTSERWRQVKHLFQVAVELPSAERGAYLADACVNDPSLHTEIESLIAAHEEPGSFLDAPVFDLTAADSAGDQVNTLVGASLGRYQILAPLGRGGMGEVYKAKDTMLGREVAIKVLHSDFSIDQDRLRRFAQEARAASALNHPNIITIHEFGQEDGVHFIVSEFIEGETLRQRMASERAPAGEIPEIAIQITSALNAAHEAGIVHRDIKPENVMVRPDGLVKVLDFGLAKLIERRSFETVTNANDASEATTEVWGGKAGAVMGTVNYMSPEQARGLAVDARTDIFSLGVMLYEMAAGHSPFARATVADSIASILEKEPPPLAQFTSEAPEMLERIIRKALSKNRKERYQTTGELLTDLDRLKSGETSVKLSTTKKRTLISGIDRRRYFAAIALAALVVAITGSVYFNKNDRAIESIAVLPFVNADGNQETEYLADAVTETLINDLLRLSSLTIRPRPSVFRYKGREIDPRAAGRELQVEAVLTGQAAVRGDEIIISLQLIAVGENRQLWGARYQRRLADLLTLQTEVAREVSENLRQRLPHEAQPPPAKRSPNNIEAYLAYSYGRHFWNKRTKEGFEKAIQHFNQAIAIDPNYALAYSGLADCHLSRASYGLSSPEEGFKKAKAAAKRALAIDDTLAEAHTSLAHIAWLHEWNWAEAERGFKLAIDLDPNYQTAHQWYAVYLSAMARHEEALATIRRAQAIDPLSTVTGLTVARILYYSRQYDQAIEQCVKVLEMYPEINKDNYWLRMAYEQRGLYDKAFEEALKIAVTRGMRPEVISTFKEAYAASGWTGYWRKHREMMGKAAGTKPASSYFIAGIYARLGDHDEALRWLQNAYDQHSDSLTMLKVDPVFDGLRSDPRFNKLLRDIGLTP